MEKMKIYDAARVCPNEALRTIQAGKLKGKSDINPMWRIKMLTELFGPCGIGWKTVDETFWTTPGANGEVVAWCSIKLLYRNEDTGEWSDPVLGIGGSMMVDTQKGNLTSNDEAFKMAHTDAISVACKALGFAANVYWDKDKTKYDRSGDNPPPPPPVHICKKCQKAIGPFKNKGKIYSPDEIAANAVEKYGDKYCWGCMKDLNAEAAAAEKAADGQC